MLFQDGAGRVYNGRSARYRLAPVSSKDTDFPPQPDEDTALCDVECPEPPEGVHQTFRMWWRKVRNNEALMIDVISRVLFPVLFLSFNGLYWPMYF